MSAVNPYITYPKDRRKIHKLRDWFEGGVISDGRLDPYEEMLIRDWTRCRTLGVNPGMREGILLPEDEYKNVLATSSFITGTLPVPEMLMLTAIPFVVLKLMLAAT